MLRRDAKASHAHSLVLSYLEIRKAIGMLGVLLPLSLGPGGWLLFDLPIQQNMSMYYHTALRDVFVGIMCSIGVFFYCYRGYDRLEHWAANLACASAFGIALLPTEPGNDVASQMTPSGIGHAVCGATFFLVLAFFSLCVFPWGIPRINVFDREFQRHTVYYVSGITILGCLALMGLHLFIVTGALKSFLDDIRAVFWLEWIAVWAFSIAWLVKGRAILRDV